MTQLEKETMEATKRAARKYIYNEVDWEQRRYEIAREVFANRFHGNITAEKAVEKADELIAALKGGEK